MTNLWIEKTSVKHTKHPTSGLCAIGHSLCSLTKSKGGADIYHFMRDVQPDDQIIHLSDRFFVGTSRAAGIYAVVPPPDPFWSSDCYVLPLRDFESIQLGLSVDKIFSPPHNTPLHAQIDAGVKHLFYMRRANGNLQLNQGAYLTPVPEALRTLLLHVYPQLKV